MSSFVVIVDWSRPQVAEEEIDRLLAASVQRDHADRWIKRGPHWGMGVRRRPMRAGAREASRPLDDQERGLAVAADGRLDNRDELIRTLDPAADPSWTDEDLIRLGYERWGRDLPRRLIGDFAFVVCDSQRRCVLAARDPFGVRPLYFHVGPSRIVLASEVEQLLAIPDLDRQLDPHNVLAYLTEGDRSASTTFFRNVRRLRPGHLLIHDPSGWSMNRYWTPPDREIRRDRAEEYEEEFRELLRRSVADRLDADRPSVAHLSGGYDSSTIVGLAAELLAADPSRLTLVSLIYPGMDCDERPLMKAMADRVPFEWEQWDGTVFDDPPDWFSRRPMALTPGDPTICGQDGDMRVAQDRGAGVILCGVGGDELLYERGIYRDLAAAGRWLRMARELSRRSPATAVFYFADVLRSLLPRRIRRLYRKVRPHRGQAKPDWLGPVLKELESHEFESRCEGPWTSATQQATWGYVDNSVLLWNIEELHVQASMRGLEYRYPYLDARLVRFVLSLPYDRRLPGGRMKSLLPRACADVLPTEIVNRERIVSFESAIRRQFRHELPILREVLWDSSPWRSEAFVDRRKARELAREPFPTDDGAWDIESVFRLWSICLLELWLRKFSMSSLPSKPNF